MPGILGANSVRDTGYNVANSLRFNSGDSAELTKTFSSAGNQKTWTFSCWIKRSAISSSTSYSILEAGHGTTPWFVFAIINDKLQVGATAGSTSSWEATPLLRDGSAWYHLVLVVDTTSSTSSISNGSTDRFRVFVNNVQQTLSGGTVPSLNADLQWNGTAGQHMFGASYGQFFDGYACEVAFIDGQALSPTSFGEYDEDSPTHWKPKDISTLTFGTNGFYLDFEDSSSLGNDISGNNHDWTPVNLTAIDQTTDTCTNNFCTFTSTDPSASAFTLTEGNCKVSKSGSGAFGLYGTNIMLSKGKWYFEVKFTADAGSDRTRAGVAAYESVTPDSSSDYSTIQGDFSGLEFTCTTGGRFNIVTAGSNNEIDGFNGYSTGDIIRFALDMDNQRLYIGRNGDFFNYSSSNTGGDPSSGSGFVTNSTTVLAAPVTPYAGHSVGVSGTSTLEYNFGNPTFSISSGNSDSEGFGNFEFAVPSGYFAICTKNLAEYGG